MPESVQSSELQGANLDSVNKVAVPVPMQPPNNSISSLAQSPPNVLSALPQVVTNRDTQETLLCIAFVFEVSTSEHGAQHHVYKLVKD